MKGVTHDRWVLGRLAGGRLHVLHDSAAGVGTGEIRELSPLARRALFERRPVTVCSLLDRDTEPGGDEWEMSWPALIYAPVARPGSRPTGLLIVGCRRPHWYGQEEIDRVGALAAVLAGRLGTTRRVRVSTR